MRKASTLTNRTNSGLSFLQQLSAEQQKNNRCTFSTRSGQTMILGLLLVVGFLPCSILTAQNITKVLKATKLFSDNVYIADKLSEIGRLVHEVQIERGRSTLFLTVSSGDYQKAWSQLIRQRKLVDQATDDLTIWPKDVQAEFGTVKEHKSSVKDFREQVSSRNVSYDKTLEFYSNINRVLISWMGREIKMFARNDGWIQLTAYYTLTLAKENMGVERARGSVFWNRGRFSDEEFEALLDCQTKGKAFLGEAVLFSPILKEEMSSRPAMILQDAIDYRRGLMNINVAEPSLENASQWFNYMTLYLDRINQAQTKMADVISETTERAGKEAESATVQTTILFALELAIYPLFAFLSVRLVREIRALGGRLASKSQHLYKEQRRNKELISQMYPESIAKKLIGGEMIEPEIFEDATVCFVVLTDFNDIVALCAADEAITALNEILDIMEYEVLKYDVYKVETREDMMLLASGVPRRNPSNCVEIADMCLSLRAKMRSVCLDRLNGQGVRLHSGICTGPVAAGIVGLKMPRYLLFGDTVNTAARMQSTGTAAGIQVSPSTGEILRNAGVYKLEQRANVQIKGKGQMYTFWLLDKTTPLNKRVVSVELM